MATNYMDRSQVFGMLALIIGILGTFIGLYNSLSDVDDRTVRANQIDTKLDQSVKTRNMVMVILAAIAIFFGIFFAVYLYKKNNYWFFVPIAIVCMGVLGLFYAVGSDLKYHRKLKIIFSFLILAITLFIVYVTNFRHDKSNWQQLKPVL